MDERTLTSRRPQEVLGELFTERASEGLYQEVDDHFSLEGHRLAAERIAAFVVWQLESDH